MSADDERDGMQTHNTFSVMKNEKKKKSEMTRAMTNKRYNIIKVIL